jgi:hypothetical protein
MVLDAIGWASFKPRQSAARAKGRYLGVGLPIS